MKGKKKKINKYILYIILKKKYRIKILHFLKYK